VKECRGKKDSYYQDNGWLSLEILIIF